MFHLLVPYFLEQDKAKKKKMAEDLLGKNGDGKLCYYYGKIENRLAENEAKGNKNGFFVGDGMTVCDLKVFTAITFNETLDDFDMDAIFKPFPKLTAFYAMMKAHEKIKAFNTAFDAQLAKTKDNAADNVHVVKGKNAFLTK